MRVKSGLVFRVVGVLWMVPWVMSWMVLWVVLWLCGGFVQV